MALFNKKQPQADSLVYANFDDLIALQQKASGFSFLPKQPVQSILSGRHGSRLRGRGLNFEDLRAYRPGDDIRTLDWKVTNRTKKPHVRVYTEERERPVLLVIDQRMTMFFGSQNKMKSVVAAELAAISAWRVLSVGDRVGAIIFNNTDIKEIKPHRSRRSVMQVLHHVVAFNHALHVERPAYRNEQQLNTVLKEVERLSGHDYLVVLISDMAKWDSDTLKSIKRISRHNDIIVSLILDPLEKELPAHNKLIVTDGELKIQVNSTQSDLKEKYRNHHVDNIDALKIALKKHGIPIIPIDTVTSVASQIRQGIGERIKNQSTKL